MFITDRLSDLQQNIVVLDCNISRVNYRKNVLALPTD